MEVWQEIAKNAERGAERLVAEYGDRLYAAATLLCRNSGDAEELVFRTLARAVAKSRFVGALRRRRAVRRMWTVGLIGVLVVACIGLAAIGRRTAARGPQTAQPSPPCAFSNIPLYAAPRS